MSFFGDMIMLGFFVLIVLVVISPLLAMLNYVKSIRSTRSRSLGAKYIDSDQFKSDFDDDYYYCPFCGSSDTDGSHCFECGADF